MGDQWIHVKPKTNDVSLSVSKIFVVPTHYFRYDVVDWTRQLMANLAHKFHSNLVDAFLKKDGKTFSENRSKLELLLSDMGTRLMHLIMNKKN